MSLYVNHNVFRRMLNTIVKLVVFRDIKLRTRNVYHMKIKISKIEALKSYKNNEIAKN